MPEITKSGTIIRSNEECAISEEDLVKFKRLMELAKQGKIRGIHINAPPQPDHIFTVTGVQYPTKHVGVRGQVYESSDFHVLGWFHTFEDAEHAVLNNIGDICECGEHTHTIIEKVHYGMFQAAWDSTWYEWSRESDGYVKCDKPAKYAHVVGFSIA